MGLDNFIIFGDVYRRDEIDSTHFPVFHQSDAVRLYNETQVNESIKLPLKSLCVSIHQLELNGVIIL